MAGRTRNRILTTYQSPDTDYWYYAPNYPNLGPFHLVGGNRVTGFQSMTDATGPFPYTDKALTSTVNIVDPLKVSGDYKGSLYKEAWNGYAPANMSGYTYCPLITPVNWDYWRTKALANMNPNKPDVDVLVNLFEMRDFPFMLRQAGRVLSGRMKASDWAGSYVAYSFGWAPLISDLKKLMKFHQHLQKRIQLLEGSAKRGGRRLRRKLGNVKPTRPGPVNYSLSWLNSPPAVQGKVVETESLRVWATARLKLLTPLPKDQSAFIDLASSLVTGRSLSASTLWEAFPWSWLMDYFLNVGDWLEANRGSVRYSITNMCVMAQSEARKTFVPGTLAGGISTSGGTLTTRVKQRAVYPVPTAMLAYGRFFTPHMVGILSSLASSRALRGIGR